MPNTRLVHPAKIQCLAIFNNLPALLLYLGKVFFPVNLSVLPLLADTTLLYGWLALSIIVVALYFSREKSPGRIVLGLVWYLIFLLPTFIRYDQGLFDFAEHRLYLAFAGLLIVMLEIDQVKKLRWTGRTGAIMVLLIIILSGITMRQVRYYHDGVSFWQNAASTSPSSLLAHLNLSGMYAMNGRYDQAIAEGRRALALDKRAYMMHNNLGMLYLRQKKYREAEAEFREELRISGRNDGVLNNLLKAGRHAL